MNPKYLFCLEVLGVKDQWFHNRKDKELPEGDTFEDFITCSFLWCNTPEGYDFWKNISKL